MHAIRSITEAAMLLSVDANHGNTLDFEEHALAGDDDDAEAVRQRELEESVVVSDGYRIVMIVAGPHFHPDLPRQREGWGWHREAATILTEILARHGAVGRELHGWESAVSA